MVWLIKLFIENYNRECFRSNGKFEVLSLIGNFFRLRDNLLRLVKGILGIKVITAVCYDSHLPYGLLLLEPVENKLDILRNV